MTVTYIALLYSDRDSRSELEMATMTRLHFSQFAKFAICNNNNNCSHLSHLFFIFFIYELGSRQFQICMKIWTEIQFSMYFDNHSMNKSYVLSCSSADLKKKLNIQSHIEGRCGPNTTHELYV